MTEQHPIIVAMAKALHERKRAWLRSNGNDTPSWDSEDMDPRFRDDLIADARAALTALLELTPDMVEAGAPEVGDLCRANVPWALIGERLARAHTAMIQHILTGSDQSPEGLDAHAARSRSDASADPQGAGQTTPATTKGER